MDDFSETLRVILPEHSLGEAYLRYTYGQFLRVQEHKYFCGRLRAEPIYDYQLPWFFYAYDSGGINMDVAIANALQQERFNWISGVPLPALKVFREEGTLESMRAVLRRGVTDLKSREDTSLLKIGQQLEENLLLEFRRQEAELSSLQEKVNRIAKQEIPIASAGALAGFIPYLGNVVSVLLAGRDISRLIDERKRANRIVSEMETNAIGLLLKAHYES